MVMFVIAVKATSQTSISAQSDGTTNGARKFVAQIRLAVTGVTLSFSVFLVAVFLVSMATGQLNSYVSPFDVCTEI